MSDIETKEKIIIYDRGLDGVFNVKVDYQKLRNVLDELRKYQYTIIGDVPTTKQTYLEYVLSSFFSGIDAEEFRDFSIITYEKNSNNAIDCIRKYVNSGELGTSDSRVISFANYGGRTFSIEKLRDLYNQIRNCITFVNRYNGEVIDFDGMQKMVIQDERVRHVLPNDVEKRKLH